MHSVRNLFLPQPYLPSIPVTLTPANRFSEWLPACLVTSLVIVIRLWWTFLPFLSPVPVPFQKKPSCPRDQISQKVVGPIHR